MNKPAAWILSHGGHRRGGVQRVSPPRPFTPGTPRKRGIMTTTNKAGALAAARAKLSEIIAERERLPHAVCFICGGIVHAGAGRSNGTPTREAIILDAKRKRSGLPALAGWSRAHDGCFDSVAVVRTITGLRVSADIAATAVGRARVTLELGERFIAPGEEAPPLPAMLYAVDNADMFNEAAGWMGQAWGHLTVEARREFADVVTQAEREHYRRTTPLRCVDGPCGACGVATSLAWWKSPMAWRDGSPAPWCADCGAVADRRPVTSDTTGMRALAIEALSGASGMGMGDRFGEFMRMFCELVEPGHPGTDERWQHAPEAWGELREAVRLALPNSLPADLADEYRAKAKAQAEAADAARRDEARAEAAAAGWPV